MTEETSIHIGPVIDIENAEKVENKETINFICCFCSKEKRNGRIKIKI